MNWKEKIRACFNVSFLIFGVLWWLNASIEYWIVNGQDVGMSILILVLLASIVLLLHEKLVKVRKQVMMGDLGHAGNNQELFIYLFALGSIIVNIIALLSTKSLVYFPTSVFSVSINLFFIPEVVSIWLLLCYLEIILFEIFVMFFRSKLSSGDLKDNQAMHASKETKILIKSEIGGS
ncbi:MAG: hypothetical protein ACTSWN_04875 [Promethearchaeota archaeon]